MVVFKVRTHARHEARERFTVRVAKERANGVDLDDTSQVAARRLVGALIRRLVAVVALARHCAHH